MRFRAGERAAPLDLRCRPQVTPKGSRRAPFVSPCLLKLSLCCLSLPNVSGRASGKNAVLDEGKKKERRKTIQLRHHSIHYSLLPLFPASCLLLHTIENQQEKARIRHNLQLSNASETDRQTSSNDISISCEPMLVNCAQFVYLQCLHERRWARLGCRKLFPQIAWEFLWPHES